MTAGSKGEDVDVQLQSLLLRCEKCLAQKADPNLSAAATADSSSDDVVHLPDAAAAAAAVVCHDLL